MFFWIASLDGDACAEETRSSPRRRERGNFTR